MVAVKSATHGLKFTMIRHSKASVWGRLLTEDNVASGLMVYRVAHLGERADRVLSGNNGYATHTCT